MGLFPYEWGTRNDRQESQHLDENDSPVEHLEHTAPLALPL